MRLDVPEVKDKMIMCRFAPAMFIQIGLLAKKNKTSPSKVIRALIEKQLSVPQKHNK